MCAQPTKIVPRTRKNVVELSGIEYDQHIAFVHFALDVWGMFFSASVITLRIIRLCIKRTSSSSNCSRRQVWLVLV